MAPVEMGCLDETGAFSSRRRRVKQ